MAALSFNGNKIIATSVGGALVSKHKVYIDQEFWTLRQEKTRHIINIHKLAIITGLAI